MGLQLCPGALRRRWARASRLCTDSSSGRNAKPWLLLCPWGSTPWFHLLLWTLSASCRRKRELFSQLVGAQGAGMGRVIPARGRARLPLGLKDKPMDQIPHAPAQKECSCPVGRLAWPKPQLLTSRQRQLLRNWLPDPRASCSVWRRVEAPQQKDTTLPPQLPPAWPQVLLLWTLY